MPFFNFEMGFDAIAVAGIVASMLAALCLNEYFCIKADNKELQKDLENPPEQLYQHDLKAFSKSADK